MGLLLESLDDEDGVEDVVPDLAGDAETEVEVLVVMSEMVFLDLGHESGQALVVHTIGVCMSMEDASQRKEMKHTHSALHRR